MTVVEILDFDPVYDRITSTLRESFLNKFLSWDFTEKGSEVVPKELVADNDTYTLDGGLLTDVIFSFIPLCL